MITENFKLFKNSEYFCMYEKAFLECSNYLFETLFKTTLGTFAGAKLIYLYLYIYMYMLDVQLHIDGTNEPKSAQQAK